MRVERSLDGQSRGILANAGQDVWNEVDYLKLLKEWQELLYIFKS